MSHTIELSDEQYEILREAAEARGESPDTIVAALIAELHATQSQPRCYDKEEWFRHLGATEEEILESKRILSQRNEHDETIDDADAR